MTPDEIEAKFSDAFDLAYERMYEAEQERLEEEKPMKTPCKFSVKVIGAGTEETSDAIGSACDNVENNTDCVVNIKNCTIDNEEIEAIATGSIIFTTEEERETAMLLFEEALDESNLRYRLYWGVWM